MSNEKNFEAVWCNLKLMDQIRTAMDTFNRCGMPFSTHDKLAALLVDVAVQIKTDIELPKE